MQQLLTFLLFKIKNNDQRQKCSGIKNLQKYVTIFYIPTVVIKILILLKNFFSKNVDKWC